VNRAAASFRALADYLEQHPQSLIRGKSAEQEPADDSGRDGGATTPASSDGKPNP
jgi:hypothetical protein